MMAERSRQYARAQDHLVKGEVDGNLLAHSIRRAIERKQVEEELHLSEENYRTLIELASDGKFAVVNVWDALTSDRPYRKAWPEDKVLAHGREQAGKHFDPYIVEIFLKEVSDVE